MLYLLKQLYHTTTEVAEQNRFSRSVYDYMEAVSNDTPFKLTGTAKQLVDMFEDLKSNKLVHGDLHFMLKNLDQNTLDWSKDVDSGKLWVDMSITSRLHSMPDAVARSEYFVKILMMLGIRRKSIEDLLAVVQKVLTQPELKDIDLRDEVKILRDVAGSKSYSSLVKDSEFVRDKKTLDFSGLKNHLGPFGLNPAFNDYVYDPLD